MAVDLWAELADERRLLADDLTGLPDAAWRATTTCGGWTVHQLLAHLTIPLTTTKVEPIVAILKARGNIDRGIEAMTMARAATPPDELLRTLRERAGRKFAPPGLGPVAPLTDVVVHGIELRRAIGVDRPVLQQRLRAALDFVSSKRAKGFGDGKRAAGRRLEATDLDWAHGDPSSPLTRATAEELLLDLTGRS